MLSKLRHSLFNLTLHLINVDVQSIAIDRTMCLEVEDRRDCVAGSSLLVDRAFNRIDRVVVRLFPLIREFRIVPMPSISSLARDSGGLGSMVDLP
jgi:hypothetical protein